jgi:hypothetical protein
MRRAGNKMGAAKLMMAGMMWDIRSKSAATVMLRVEDGTSTEAGIITGVHAQYHLTTSPYSAYNRWQSTLAAAGFVTREVKASYPHHSGGVVSRVFTGKTKPLFSIPVGKDSRIFRYAVCPERLGRDIEKTLREIREDVAAVILYYDKEPEDHEAALHKTSDKGKLVQPLALEALQTRPAESSYWDVVARMDQLDAVDLVDEVCRMDNATQLEIESAEYESAEALKAAVWGLVSAGSLAKGAVRDAVV